MSRLGNLARICRADDFIDNLGGSGYTEAEMTAANAMLELSQSGAPPTVPRLGWDPLEYGILTD